MIVQRIIFIIVAIAALSAAAAITVFAAAFALYALLRDSLTPAGAAAVVALAAAVLAALAAFVASRKARGPQLKRRASYAQEAPSDSVIDRVVSLARDRPFIAAGAATAAGLLALANPALVTAVMRAFISPGRPPKR